jgi:hypothetical protein
MQYLDSHRLVAMRSIEAKQIRGGEYRAHSALAQYPLHAVALSQHITRYESALRSRPWRFHRFSRCGGWRACG